MSGVAALEDPSGDVDPTEAAGVLLRRLGTSREGLSASEAQRRLLQYGPTS